MSPEQIALLGDVSGKVIASLEFSAMDELLHVIQFTDGTRLALSSDYNERGAWAKLDPATRPPLCEHPGWPINP